MRARTLKAKDLTVGTPVVTPNGHGLVTAINVRKTSPGRGRPSIMFKVDDGSEVGEYKAKDLSYQEVLDVTPAE